MMKFEIYILQKKSQDPKMYQEAMGEYLKRLGAYAKVSAKLINESSVQGISKFHFYIGDLGSEEAKPFHVSSFTQSGSLAGTIILEQIYRAYRILNHQPYHK